MATIKNIDNLSTQEIVQLVNQGGKFVVFQYTISILIMTFKNASDIHFIRPNEGTFGMSIGYTLLTLVLGWWGIPWGPIYSIGSIYTNLTGGKDLTPEIMSHFRNELLQQQATANPTYNVGGGSNAGSGYNIPQ